MNTTKLITTLETLAQTTIDACQAFRERQAAIVEQPWGPSERARAYWAAVSTDEPVEHQDPS